MTKDDENAEVLNAFLLASVFSSKSRCYLGTQPLELEDGEGDEVPMLQGGMVCDLLHNMDTHKSVGLDEIDPREEGTCFVG